MEHVHMLLSQDVLRFQVLANNKRVVLAILGKRDKFLVKWD